ncbi:MAG: MBL fold metallo-hydrolase [Candidatus Obscuribacterales bacterium]|nr:MBL fold metallo-hydrolase [Candidatus Obscuribacterales bacterium]
MFFKQYYLPCLSHASYMLGSEGNAIVIDPQRDIDQYLEDARSEGLSIKYVIETHLHADFVSGHAELAARAGAKIIIGENSQAKFMNQAVKDGDELKLGNLELKFIATPGHTPESICILATNTAQPEEAAKLFSGDTLFIGDVGRPDLVATKDRTAAEMAGLLYESLHNKIMSYN